MRLSTFLAASLPLVAALPLDEAANAQENGNIVGLKAYIEAAYSGAGDAERPGPPAEANAEPAGGGGADDADESDEWCEPDDNDQPGSYPPGNDPSGNDLSVNKLKDEITDRISGPGDDLVRPPPEAPTVGPEPGYPEPPAPPPETPSPPASAPPQTPPDKGPTPQPTPVRGPEPPQTPDQGPKPEYTPPRPNFRKSKGLEPARPKAPTPGENEKPDVYGTPKEKGKPEIYGKPGPANKPQTPQSDSGSKGNNVFLAKHNEYRQLHGAPALAWDESLEQSAQAHADKCTMQHGGYPSGVGQNLFMASGTGAGPQVSANACDSWYGEGNKFQYNSGGFSTATGHFTQMVWKSMQKLGCAVSKECGGKAHVVFHYEPAGNFQGQYQNNVQPPMSASGPSY